MSSLKKKAKVVMLPTEKAENCLYLQSGKLHYHRGYLTQDYLKNSLNAKSFHLYILSDDKIKEGEICPYIMWWASGTFELFNSNNRISESRRLSGLAKKIIAATDTLKVGTFDNNLKESIYLPQPSPQFIQKFIEQYNKGNIITDVMVEYDGINPNMLYGNRTDSQGNYYYSCPICKETDSYMGKGTPTCHKNSCKDYQLKVDRDNYITITKCKPTLKELYEKTLTLKRVYN